MLVPIFDGRVHDGSVDAGVDPRVGDKTWTKLENAVFNRRGAISKRHGYGAKSTSRVSGATHIASDGKVPLIYKDGQWHRWNPSSDSLHAIERVTYGSRNTAPLLPVINTTETIVGRASDGARPVAYYRGSTWYAIALWDDSSLSLRVYDEATDTLLSVTDLGTTDSGDPAEAHIVDALSGANVYYVADAGAYDAIFHRTIADDGSVGSTVTEVTSCVTIPSGRYFDAQVVLGGDVHIAKILSGTGEGVASVTIDTYGDPVGGTVTVTTLLTAATSGQTVHAVSVFGGEDTDDAVYAWGRSLSGTHYIEAMSLDTSGIVYTVVTVDSWLLTAANPVIAIVGIDREGEPLAMLPSSSTIFWTRHPYSATPTVLTRTDIYKAIVYDNAGAGAVSGSPSAWVRSATLWAKPVAYADAERFLVGVSHDCDSPITGFAYRLQSSCYIVTDESYPVARASIGFARPAPWHPVALSAQAGAYETVTQRLARGVTAADDGNIPADAAYGVQRCILSISDTPRVLHRDQQVYIAGSVPMTIDTAIREHGFLIYPDPILLYASGTGSIDVGEHFVTVVYETVDERGNRIQSSPTPAVAKYNVTGTGDTELTVQVPALPLGIGGVVLAVAYRTEAGGSIYYRDTWAVAVPGAGSGYVSIVMTRSDSDLKKREQLYMVDLTAEVANIAPPPHSVSTWHQSRHCVAVGNEPVVQYSKPLVAAPDHNETLSITIDHDDAITALASLSGYLLVFFADRIYAVAGDLLPASAIGAGPQRAQLVSPSVGCIDQRSVTETPGGLIFAAKDGLWRISRALQVEPLGDRVRWYTDEGGAVIGAATLHEQHLVIVAQGNSEDPLLVYDWLRDKWCTWTVGGAETTAGIVEIDGVLYRLGADGFVRRWGHTTAYDDDGAYQSLLCELGYISKGALGGWLRLDELVAVLRSVAAHTLHVWVGYDGDAAWPTSDRISKDSPVEHVTVSDLRGDGDSDNIAQAYTVQLQPTRAKCESFRVRIYDEQQSGQGIGAGYELHALSADLRRHEGAQQIGATRRLEGT